MRIVSLLASATEIVCELGLEDRLVGISHECDHPERILDRPRVSAPRFDADELSSGEIDRAVRESMAEHGSVYRIDGDLLEELRPDLVLTQAVCDVCAVPTSGVRELVEERGLDADVVSLDAHTLDGIFRTVLQVGRAAGAEERAWELVAGYRARLDAVERRVGRVPDAERPRVLALEWIDPPFAPGHWVPEMVEAAGGRDLLGAAGERSERVTWEDATGLDPDVLVVMPCGYDLEASVAEARRHGARLRDAAPGPVRRDRAWAVDASSYFNRSGPRVVRGVEILEAILWPGEGPEPDPVCAARLSDEIGGDGYAS